MKGYFTNNRDRLPNNTLLLINHITIYTPHLPATILNLKMNCLLIYPGVIQNTPIKHHSFTENGESDASYFNTFFQSALAHNCIRRTNRIIIIWRI